MEKSAYENLKDIRTRIEKGEPTTFAERNIANIHAKIHSLHTGSTYRQPKKNKASHILKVK